MLFSELSTKLCMAVLQNRGLKDISSDSKIQDIVRERRFRLLTVSGDGRGCGQSWIGTEV